MALPVLITLGAFAWSLEESGGRSPLVTGIFPPGIMVGTRQEWTITGRNLDRVTSVVGSGDGLVFQAFPSEADGRSLIVEVEAKADATTGYREIRVDGPNGISNLALVRVDSLPQVVEVEPNDRTPAPGQVIRVGTAVAGTIRPLDVDRFRVEGKPGQKVTLDWELRRLGTAIIPVLTITGPARSAIAQVRSSRGGDRECRASVVIPTEGWFEVELRDNTYGGDDRCRYRLRVDPAPFASAMFPLGGPPGVSVGLTLRGGSLAAPLEKLVSLPDVAGTWFDPGGFHDRSSGSDVFASGRVQVGNGISSEIVEPINLPSGAVVPVTLSPTGLVINGQISKPGEVDRYRVEARAGDRLRFRVEAAACGSSLDSVLTVRNARGELLGESDDSKPASMVEPPGTIDDSASTDSLVDLGVQVDGPVTVELADRFDSGGPDYAYRFEVGPPLDDFTLFVIPSPTAAEPGIDARAVADPDELLRSSRLPGRFGAFNLRPGTATPVHFLVVPQGRPGSIEVRAEGLPPGVTCEPVLVRLASAPRSKNPLEVPFDAPAVVDSLRLRVAADAQPSRSSLRIAARRRSLDGTNRPVLEREASMVVGVDAAGGPGRPVIRVLRLFPVRVLGVSPR